MADDWETLADEPTAVVLPVKAANANKWEGEDEDEDVKDSWEDDDEAEEEKKDDEKTIVVKANPKKSLREKIAEKELARAKEAEQKQRELEEQMSDESKLAAKLRLKAIQEEADLRVAMDTFGVSESDLARGPLDGANPINKAELLAFKDDLVKKITLFKAVEGFPSFIEELVQGICVNLGSTDLQKIKKSVDNLYTEKQKLEKEKSKKAAGKGKSKASLRMDGDKIQAYDTYEYEDFM